MRAKALVFPVAIFLGFFLIYYLGSFSRIPFGDCIGFVADTEKGAFVLSTSTYAHFLFINVLVLIKKMLPFAESSEVGRFVVIISSCICLVILYRIVQKFTEHRFSSIFSTLIFGLSFTFWRNSEIIEIYTFNLIWIGLFLLFSLRFLRGARRKDLLLAALVLGISLFSHIQNVLMIPAFLLLLFYSKDRKASAAALAVLALFLALLIAVPVLTGSPVSDVFSAGTVLDTLSGAGILKGLLSAIGYLVYNFWYFTFFAIIGSTWLYRFDRRFFLFLGFSAVPVFAFSVIFGVSDSYVFFLPFNFIVALLCGLGIYGLSKNKIARLAVLSSLLIPAFYLLSYAMVGTTEKGSKFDAAKSYKGGLSYYLLPWMTDNVGILEFVLERRVSPDPMQWMEKSALEFIQLKKAAGYSEEQLKKL